MNNLSLQQLLKILAAHYKVALLVFVITVAVIIGITFVLPAQYTATATVLVDSRSPDPIATVMMQSGMVPQLSLASQMDIIKSDRVARRVVSMLKLDQNEDVIRKWKEETNGRGKLEVWLAALFLKKLTVKQVARESTIITITFEATDPAFAEAVANAFAQTYINVNIELKVEPAKQYLTWFSQQSKLLRENLEKAQENLSRFQQDKGIVTSDESRDNEMAKLGALSTLQTTAQGQTADALTKQKAGDVADTLPEVAQHPVITHLKSDITTKESKLKETAVNLGKNHPQYQRMVAELAVIKEQLEIEVRHIAKGFTTSHNVSKDKQAEMRNAISEQSKKLLQMRIDRDNLAVLQRDVDAAKKAFENVTNRQNQISLDSQSTLTNVVILTPAVAPFEPSFPKITVFVLGAIGAGIMLGIAAACLPELLNRRIRSAEDFSEIPEMQVLGSIDRPQATRRPRFALGNITKPWRHKHGRAGKIASG